MFYNFPHIGYFLCLPEFKKSKKGQDSFMKIKRNYHLSIIENLMGLQRIFTKLPFLHYYKITRILFLVKAECIVETRVLDAYGILKCDNKKLNLI